VLPIYRYVYVAVCVARVFHYALHLRNAAALTDNGFAFMRRVTLSTDSAGLVTMAAFLLSSGGASWYGW